MERFFDESGGMQLVIHSPHGTRINRAWGLRCERRFCRSFNLNCRRPPRTTQSCSRSETQHSFPLDEVFRYLNSKSVREVLVSGVVGRSNVYDSLALGMPRGAGRSRQRGGRRLAAPLQRMESENLLAASFPTSLPVLRNVPGDREVPDHPLVNQTISDCLTEAMDIEGLEQLLRDIEAGPS